MYHKIRDSALKYRFSSRVKQTPWYIWDRFMNRRELIRRFVLRVISDDYENVDQIILPDVAADGARCGLTIERSDVVDALAGLIEDGLAKAYLLSGTKPHVTELRGMPSIEVVEEYFRTYFYITTQGRDLHLSDDTWWPFDDEDNLRPGWQFDP
jgi:hypothetical protein